MLGGSGVAVISSSDGGTNVLSSVSEIVVPLLREEVEVKKKIVVTDEVVITKKLVSGIERITEQVHSETISTEPGNPKILGKKDKS